MPTDRAIAVRYHHDGHDHYGILEGAEIARLSAAPWLGGVDTGARDSSASVTLRAPVEPTKVVCVGLNYRAHVAESVTMQSGPVPAAEPLLFLKPPSALVGPGEAIRYPPGVTRMDPEAEMAIVIGRRARRVPIERAGDFIAGVTAFNDVSARNFQRADGQWTRAKGFDTFAPVGPGVTLGLDPSRLVVECRVNGAPRQRGLTADLIFPVPLLVSHISHIMTLEPGDLIATGTPAGVAPIQVGDRVEVEVEGVGVLSNPVEAWGS